MTDEKLLAFFDVWGETELKYLSRLTVNELYEFFEARLRKEGVLVET